MKIAGIILVSIAGQSPGWPIWIKWFDDKVVCQQEIAEQVLLLNQSYVVHSQGCIEFTTAQPQPQPQPQPRRRPR